MLLMLRLLAKTAARTCSVVFYCAVPNISGKARLKGRLSGSAISAGKLTPGDG
jgi:hypothetical protein